MSPDTSETADISEMHAQSMNSKGNLFNINEKELINE